MTTRHKPDSLLRLAALLRRDYDRVGSYLAMEKAITKLTQTIVDRRKLQQIVDHTSVAITFAQLEALDRYLSEHYRAPLATLFECPNALGSLVARGQVRILLGSQPRRDERRIDLSRWDTRAMHEVFVGINKISGSVRLDVVDGVYTPPAKAETCAELGMRQGWGDAFTDDGPSLIGIGSPRANLAAEVMLADMFGVRPFCRPEEPLPFGFVWSPVKGKQQSSAFAAAAPDSQLAKAVAAGKKWALLIRGRPHPLDLFVPRSTTYGVLAVQRRRGGQVWMVLAGLSGPGTYAAAQFVGDAKLRVPASVGGEHSSVCWMTVRAEVEARATPGDDREVVRVESLTPSEVWDRPL